MAIQGFDKDYYLNAKLEQLQNDPATSATWAGKTADSLESRLLDGFGLTAEQHYEQYGYQEGLAPNAYFDPQEYIQAKAVAMVNDPASSYTSVDAAAQAFVELWGGNVYQHYLQYGASEGINPSNDFDASGYLDEKLAALQAAGETQYQTADDVKAALADAGLTPLAHFLEYGQQEGLSAPAVPADEQVTVDNSVAGETFSLTANADKLVAADYELAEGETEEDVVRTTAGDDTIEATASALSSARTLDADDSIDAGAGNDTLNVDVQGNFSGFSEDGGVTNVETIALTNEGSINRSFDATGVEGDVNYVVNAGDATVNLIDVGSAGSSVTLNNQADGAFSIGYATDVTDGTSDNLALNLNAVGTVDDADTSANEEEAVAITAAGVESATVSATGDNVVDLSGVSATSYTAEGEGSLKVTDLADGLVSFDASALAGDLNLTVDTSVARKNATIAGGEGAEDTVSLTGGGTVQYAMSGVENVVLTETATKTTFSATNASGIAAITAAAAGEAVFAGLGNADLTLNLLDNSGDVTLDNSGTTTVNVADSTATADSNVTVSGATTLSNGTAAVINVAENMIFDGHVNANKAESVSLAAAGTLNGATVQAGNASEVVISEVGEDATLDLIADDAEQLTVTAASDLDLTAGGNTALSSLQVLDAEIDGKLTVGALEAINTVNLEGTGEADLGLLGNVDQDGYGITVNAGSLSDTDNDDDALTIAGINTEGTNIAVNAAGVLDGVNITASLNANNGATTAGNVTVDVSSVGGDIALSGADARNITVDASGALGTLNTGTLTGEAVTVNGGELGSNTVTVDASKSVNLSGGIENDDITLTDSTAADAKLSGSIDGGLGTDTLTAASDADLTGVTVSNIETFDVDGNDVTLNASVVSGSDATIDDTSAGGSLILEGTSGADTIDLSGLTNNATIQVNGSQGADTITASAGTDVFTYTDLNQIGDTVNNFGTSGTDLVELAASEFVLGTGGSVSAQSTGSATTLIFAGTDAAAWLSSTGNPLAFAGTDAAAWLSSTGNPLATGAFAVLFRDTAGTDAGLHYITGSVATAAVASGTATTATAAAVYASSNVQDLVITGATDQIAAADIALV